MSFPNSFVGNLKNSLGDRSPTENFGDDKEENPYIELTLGKFKKNTMNLKESFFDYTITQIGIVGKIENNLKRIRNLIFL